MFADRPHMPAQYGVPKAAKGLLPWSHVTERMTRAKHYWICSVSPDGRPHATPVDALWLDDRLYFGGSTDTKRYRNLAANPAVTVHLEDAMDVVILHGDVAELRDPVDAELAAALARESKKKYGFAPKPGDYGRGGVFVVQPRTVMAWSKFPKDATRWRFR